MTLVGVSCIGDTEMQESLTGRAALQGKLTGKSAVSKKPAIAGKAARSQAAFFQPFLQKEILQQEILLHAALQEVVTNRRSCAREKYFHGLGYPSQRTRIILRVNRGKRGGGYVKRAFTGAASDSLVTESQQGEPVQCQPSTHSFVMRSDRTP